MTHSKLKEQFARLGRVRDINRVTSGSPVNFVLRVADTLAQVRTIDATMVLARRGMTMLRAKRVVEAVVENGEGVAQLPTVESMTALVGELHAAGLRATRLSHGPVDVRAMREKLGLSQEQFALRYNLDLDTVQNWEQGRYQPDRASANYLRVIARQPEAAAAAQEEDIGTA